MKTYKLVALGGQLFFPTGGYPNETEPSMLIRVYPAGDCDTCCWPMRNDKDKEILAHALYDEREINSTWTIREEVQIMLPDGEIFNFDELVS